MSFDIDQTDLIVFYSITDIIFGRLVLLQLFL